MLPPVQHIASILGLSVVSGVNLYLAVLTVGLAERFQWISNLPAELHVLSHPAVLIAASVLFLLEFFADKIPFFTMLWDTVHTFIRPVGGALLALGTTAHLSPSVQAVSMLAGGTIALGAHGAKMGTRLLAHAAPEPATHSAISVAEDLGVIGLITLAFAHPYIAIPVLIVIIIGIALILPLVIRTLHFVLVVFTGWVSSLMQKKANGDYPAWLNGFLEKEGLPQVGVSLPLRAFAAKKPLRLREGFLVQRQTGWFFVWKSFFKVKTFDMQNSEPACFVKNLFFQSVFIKCPSKSYEFFIPKHWRQGNEL